MASDNSKPEYKKRVIIASPTKHHADFSKMMELDHGLFLHNINPNITEKYLQAFFREYGTVTLCEKYPKMSKEKTMALVRFSTANEADEADWAGPHDIGGTEVKVTRIITKRLEDDSFAVTNVAPVRNVPRRSMGLGYMLEDSEWLDNE